MPVDRGLDPRVAIAVLGPLRLRSPRGRVKVRSRVSRRLLCALVLSESHEATAEALTGAIWGDTPGSRSVLPVAVHRCRHTLMEQGCDRVGIKTTATGYRLVLDGATTDLDLFTELITLAPHDPSALDAALALWRGPVAADEPLVAEHFHLGISVLERQRRQVALTLARGAVEAGEPGRALAALKPLARADPLDEELAATSIEALAAAGQRHDALAEFRRISSALAQELGIPPSPVLRLAYQRCLDVQGHAAERSDRRPLPPPPPDSTGRHEPTRRITARSRLRRLQRAQRIGLRPFRHDEAIELIRVVVGSPGMEGHEEAAVVAAYRGYLRLAVRVAALRLAARRRRSVERMAASLAADRSRARPVVRRLPRRPRSDRTLLPPVCNSGPAGAATARRPAATAPESPGAAHT